MKVYFIEKERKMMDGQKNIPKNSELKLHIISTWLPDKVRGSEESRKHLA